MPTLWLTLADYETHPQPLVAGVAKILRANSKVLDVLPMPMIAALSVKVIRETGMANVPAWRKKGTSTHSSYKATTPDEVQERAFSIGNEIQVDKVDLEDKTPKLYDPFTYQTEMIVKGIARAFTDKFINGLPTDVDNPVGIYWRVTNDLPSSQRIPGAADDGTGGIDLSPDASGLAANIQTFIDKLDKLLYAVTDDPTADGAGVYIMCNDSALLRIQSLFRQSGLLQTTTDALGRIWQTYKGARFLDVGPKADETNASYGTRIIGNAETGAGVLTGGAMTSLYACRMGPEYLTGWQMYSMMVSDLELDPVHKLIYTSVIDWAIGIAVSHPRSIARLYGLTVL